MSSLTLEKKTSLPIFDNLLESKVGFGRYQYIAYVILGCVLLSDGAEILSLSILLKVIQKEFQLTEQQQSQLGSILFVGILVGSLLTGLVSDRIGRRKTLLYASFAQFAVGVLSASVNDVYLFILIRGLFGAMIGFTMPLAPAFATEITPLEFRGKGIVLLNFFYTIGKLYAILIAVFCLDDLTSGNWRAMLILSSVPSLIVGLGTFFYLHESPRFLVAVGEIDEGARVLNYISRKNRRSQHEIIFREEKAYMIEWHRAFAKPYRAPIYQLFSKKYLRITILLWMIWFWSNFLYYGMVLILPFILSQLEIDSGGKSNGLLGLFYTILGEVPSLFVSLYFVEKAGFGRKYTLAYTNFASLLSFVLAYITGSSILVPLFSMSRFFSKLSWSMIYPLTSEVYPTEFRTSGFGFASAVGRIGSVVMPYVLLGLFERETLLPLMAFAFASLFTGLAAYFMPFDTRGRALDLDEHENTQIQMSELLLEKDELADRDSIKAAN